MDYRSRVEEELGSESVIEKERVIPCCILKSASFISKEHPSIVKFKVTIHNKDVMPIEKVVDSSNDWGVDEANVNIKGVPGEGEAD